MGNEPRVSGADIDELVARMDDAAKAYIRGDHQRYFTLFDHGDDYSLMPPYGGDTRHGFDLTEQDIAEGSTFFVSGEAVLDVEQTYISGDLVVLVAIERQHGVVGDLPDQTCRCGSRWSSGAPVTAGKSCTAMPTPWCARSRSTTSPASRGETSPAEPDARPEPKAGSRAAGYRVATSTASTSSSVIARVGQSGP